MGSEVGKSPGLDSDSTVNSLFRMQLRLEPGLAIGAADPLTPPMNTSRGSRC